MMDAQAATKFDHSGGIMGFSFWRSRGDEAPISIPAIGLDLFMRMPPATSDGTMTVIDTINAPGFGPPRHRHSETEVFRVLEGRYLFEVDGERFHADGGDLVSVPGAPSTVSLTSRTDRHASLSSSFPVSMLFASSQNWPA